MEKVCVFVIYERHIAILAFGCPATLAAHHHRGKSATVLEDYGLTSVVDGMSHILNQFLRQRTAVEFLFALFAHIHNLDIGKYRTLKSLSESNKTVTSGLGLMVSLHRRRGRAQ